MEINERMITRNRNKAFFEETTRAIDVTTGEIVSEVQRTVRRTEAEPDYIKLYYSTMLSFNEMTDIPLSFVMSLAKFISWTNDGQETKVYLPKPVKQEIADDCGLSLSQIDKYIRKSVEVGLLFRTEYRAMFSLNPFFIARGKWESIEKLRTTFDFKKGKWERVTEFKENEETEKKIAPKKRRKQA